MQIDIQKTCSLLKENNNFLILTHAKPDGDTLGSGFALKYALESLGKKAKVQNPDGFFDRYKFIFGEYIPEDFTPDFVISADVASVSLLEHLADEYKDKIDLAIDHHKFNTVPAKNLLLNSDYPATALIIYDIINKMHIKIDKKIANALFTGLSTDTGCFKYDSVTPHTHRAAAHLIECGAEHGKINKLMFDTISRGRMEIDRAVLSGIEYYFEGKCAIIVINKGMPEKYNVNEDELDGISALPRKIENVIAGVTIREKKENLLKISLRTGDGLDSSKICAVFGGGGHKNAGGCSMNCSVPEAKNLLLKQIGLELENLG